jgi:tetratricopeptide (TPR) repeat protein
MADFLFGFLPDTVETVVKIGLLILGTALVLVLLVRRFSHRRALFVHTFGSPAEEYHVEGREIADGLRRHLAAIWYTHSAEGTEAEGESTSLGSPKRKSEDLGSRAMSLMAGNSPIGFLVGLSSRLWPTLELEGELVSGENGSKLCGARLKKGKRYFHSWQLPVPEGKGGVEALTEELAYRIVLDTARGRVLDNSRSAGTKNWRALRSLTEAMQRWTVSGFKHSDPEHVEAVDQKLEEAISHDPDYALAHFNRGILWLRTIRDAATNARAREHFLEAGRLAKGQVEVDLEHPNFVDRRVEGLAALGVARTYSQDRHRFGRTDDETVKKARQAAGEAVHCLPGDPDAMYAQAFAFHCTETLEDIRPAAEIYRKIIGNKHGKFPGVHNNLGYIQMVGGEHLRNLGYEDKAREWWKQAEEQMLLTIRVSDPRSRTIEFSHANLGNLYRLQGRYREAEREYLKALGPDPEKSQYTNGLNEFARLLLEMGRVEEGNRFHRLALATTDDPASLQKLETDIAPLLGTEEPREPQADPGT